jgi:hypothetical protein
MAPGLAQRSFFSQELFPAIPLASQNPFSGVVVLLNFIGALAGQLSTALLAMRASHKKFHLTVLVPSS